MRAILAIFALEAAAASSSSQVVRPESYRQMQARAGSENDAQSGWPYAPFSTQGRDIVNNRGEKIVWAGVNWPMSGMVLLLQVFLQPATNECVSFRRDYDTRGS